MPQVLGTAATAAVIPTDPPDGSSVARALSLLWLSFSLCLFLSFLRVSVCLSVALSLCLLPGINMYTCLSGYLDASLSVIICLPACLSAACICLSILRVYMFVSGSAYLSVYPACMCLSLALPICLPLSLSLSHTYTTVSA